MEGERSRNCLIKIARCGVVGVSTFSIRVLIFINFTSCKSVLRLMIQLIQMRPQHYFELEK